MTFCDYFQSSTVDELRPCTDVNYDLPAQSQWLYTAKEIWQHRSLSIATMPRSFLSFRAKTPSSLGWSSNWRMIQASWKPFTVSTPNRTPLVWISTLQFAQITERLSILDACTHFPATLSVYTHGWLDSSSTVIHDLEDVGILSPTIKHLYYSWLLCNSF
jgi:hypothetical protein